MSNEIRQWYFALYKGRIANYVARDDENPERIVAAITTSVSKGKLNAADVQRMLDEVYNESVRPFLDKAHNGPERLERFRTIKSYFQTNQVERTAE